MADEAAPIEVWMGDEGERELAPHEAYLAVYAAGGGKRNMANFVRDQVGGASADPMPQFRSADVFVHISADFGLLEPPNKSQLFICRYASTRGEWVLKTVPFWRGHTQLKLIPEWFKARFWDNKQEKKHPWFMFCVAWEAPDGEMRVFSSNAFPVHQYYPTGTKKTDPNEAGCRAAFHRVLKSAPSTLLRRDALGSGGAAGGSYSAPPVGSSRRPSTSSVSSGGPLSPTSPFSPSPSDSAFHFGAAAAALPAGGSRAGRGAAVADREAMRQAEYRRYHNRLLSLSPASATSSPGGSDSPPTPWGGEAAGGVGGGAMDVGPDEKKPGPGFVRGPLSFDSPPGAGQYGLRYGMAAPEVGDATLKNIGQSGLDAVQALLALRDAPTPVRR